MKQFRNLEARIVACCLLGITTKANRLAETYCPSTPEDSCFPVHFDYPPGCLKEYDRKIDPDYQLAAAADSPVRARKYRAMIGRNPSLRWHGSALPHRELSGGQRTAVPRRKVPGRAVVSSALGIRGGKHLISEGTSDIQISSHINSTSDI